MEWILFGLIVWWFVSRRRRRLEREQAVEAAVELANTVEQTAVRAWQAQSDTQFNYQETGRSPERDASGRVVVKCGSGSGAHFELAFGRVEPQLVQALMQDSLTTQATVRMVRNRGGLVEVQTLEGQTLAAIRPVDQELANFALDIVAASIVKFDPNLRGERIVLEVSARLTASAGTPKKLIQGMIDLAEPAEISID